VNIERISSNESYGLLSYFDASARFRRRTEVRAHAVKQGVLFVSHDAARAGAQIELLHFLRWFKRNGNRPFSILLGAGGDLVPDLEELAKTWSMDRSHWHPYARRSNVLNAMGMGAWARRAEVADVHRFAAKCSPALIYANSIASARAIELLPAEIPVLTHVHELESYFRAQPQLALSYLLGHTRKFIACSNATRDYLSHEHGIATDKIETLHESIPVSQIRAQRTRQDVLMELGMPDDALLIIGAGTPCWRKGTDLFIQVARTVCQHRSSAHLVWIGSGPPSEMAQLRQDARVSGIADKVRFTGGVLKPADYMAAADIFLLTSREDPYPLVCLEAAALGKPMVCFADAGGAPEFVEDDCGFVVPYLDMMAMAERVIFLLDERERRLAMGEAAREKVTQRHDTSRAAPRIMEIMERTIAGR
jgi:glycosyltransferase involved in cell wall biosynthesis